MQNPVQNNPPTLYLLPNTLIPEEQSPKTAYQSALVSQGLRSCIENLDGILCESAKGARALLKLFGIQKPLYILPKELARPGKGLKKPSTNKTSATHEQNIELAKEVLSDIFTPDASCWGLISDAGLIGVADPGAALVYAARTAKNPIEVESLYGMSSVTLALSLSGLEGKSFSFEGYLPRGGASNKANQTIYQEMQQASRKGERVIAWMDTPYRHKEAVEKALDALHDLTLFSVVQNIGSEQEFVCTLPVISWRAKMRKQSLSLQEGPAIYLLRSF